MSDELVPAICCVFPDGPVRWTEADLDEVVECMVSAFLVWKLPNDFAPDAGITFTPPHVDHMWPVGTNLLTAGQTREMVLHMLKAVGYLDMTNFKWWDDADVLDPKPRSELMLYDNDHGK